jgi:hypothetical protein
MIMHPVNLSVGGRGMEDIGGVRAITGTEDAPRGTEKCAACDASRALTTTIASLQINSASIDVRYWG